MKIFEYGAVEELDEATTTYRDYDSVVFDMFDSAVPMAGLHFELKKAGKND